MSWIIKVGLIGASFYYVVAKILAEQFVFAEMLHLFESNGFILVLTGVLLLMILNWLLESKKWQILASSHHQISFSSALKSILAGVSMDAVLPFGVGSASSKLLSIKEDGKQELVAPVIVAQGVQSFWTVLFGLYGIGQLTNYTNVFTIYGASNLFLLGLVGAISIAYILWKVWPQLGSYIIESLTSISIGIWAKISLLSLSRYLLFFVQLLALSSFLSPKIPFNVLAGCITWMFFAKTIVPKPGHLGALGIRGASVVFFLNLAGYASGEVVLATLILWFINLAIPSLVGLWFVKDINLKTQ